MSVEPLEECKIYRRLISGHLIRIVIVPVRREVFFEFARENTPLYAQYLDDFAVCVTFRWQSSKAAAISLIDHAVQSNCAVYPDLCAELRDIIIKTERERKSQG